MRGLFRNQAVDHGLIATMLADAVMKGRNRYGFISAGDKVDGEVIKQKTRNIKIGYNTFLMKILYTDNLGVMDCSVHIRDPKPQKYFHRRTIDKLFQTVFNLEEEYEETTI